METTLRAALWRQFGAALDMLENTMAACPPELWTRRLWHDPPDQPLPRWLPAEFAEFWYVAYHTLFWLDLYLLGCPEEEFTPPAPFIWTENDPAVSPERPYTKEELMIYLAALRRKCRTTLGALTEEQARQRVEYPWVEGQVVSFLELLLYNMRHVVEHTAQLNLFLGQQAVPEVPGMVTRAKDDLGSP
jgi:uncharacterized damage-inducible protein DinB